MDREYVIIVKPEAENDIRYLKKSGNRASLRKIIRILEELKHHPYSGTGKPEPLKYELYGYLVSKN